ncbi:MAG: EAL domain-containing protein [Roseobacter sp.]
MSKLKRKMRRAIRRFCISKPNSLWKRYTVGFVFILATLIGSHLASLATIKAAEDDAEVLSVSSRQKMLSQRILFLLSEREHSHDKSLDRRIEDTLDLFETSHDWLVSRPDLSPRLQQLYFDQEPITLDAFSRRFIHLVGIATVSQGEQAEKLHHLLAKWGTADLLSSLSVASDLFKTHSEAQITALQNIQRATLIAGLFVLLAEALLIFLPAQLSVNTAIRRLEFGKKQLNKSLKVLKERNEDLVSARKSLTRAANHDALTGLLNRRAVYEHLSTEAKSEQGGDFNRCVMKIDLDLFKQVNDTLGHDAGDRVLVRVAEILEAETRAVDPVGRIGGDEFVVLWDNPPSLEIVEDLARRIIEAICVPVTLDNTQCQVGASIGYTIAASSVATPDQLLIEADLALYEAKRSGRGMSRAYSDALAAEIETRRVLFNEITTALADDQFEPYLQPQIYTETGEIYGCEVLARWRHPARGIVPPATFIAAAEEAGLVDQIDRIIIEKGLDALEKLLALGVELPAISINASPSTLRDPHLKDRLLQEVKARHLTPAHLTVEVLESTLIENDDDVALRTIESLSDEGFSVVLDDFGTGYASMSNLSRLHLSGIKLDQSLIRPVPEPRADSIISALVTLSSNLKMNVVAEGVETAEHFDTVKRLGCDVVQGYWIGKPMSASDFIQWHATYRPQNAILRKSA